MPLSAIVHGQRNYLYLLLILGNWQHSKMVLILLHLNLIRDCLMTTNCEKHKDMKKIMSFKCVYGNKKYTYNSIRFQNVEKFGYNFIFMYCEPWRSGVCVTGIQI